MRHLPQPQVAALLVHADPFYRILSFWVWHFSIRGFLQDGNEAGRPLRSGKNPQEAEDRFFLDGVGVIDDVDETLRHGLTSFLIIMDEGIKKRVPFPEGSETRW